MTSERAQNLDKMEVSIKKLESLVTCKSSENPTSSTEFKATLNDFRSAAQGLADEIGMGEWFRKTTAPQEKYVEPVDLITWRTPTSQDEVMIVEAQSGHERKIVHQWAENHGLKSAALKTKLFEECLVWACPECKSVYYFQEMNSTPDYATNGSYYGSYFRCPYCDECDGDDGEYRNCGVLYFGEHENVSVTYNAVIIYQGQISDLKIRPKNIRRTRKGKGNYSHGPALIYPPRRKVVYRPKGQILE